MILPSAPTELTEPTDLQQILPWYTGKALERVLQLLPALAEAERMGAWLPKLSKTARAVLSKQNVAEKFARVNDRDYDPRPGLNNCGLLVDIGDVRGRLAHESKLRGWTLVHAMMFGKFEQAPGLIAHAEALAPYVLNDAERIALARARQWAIDFTSVAHLVAQLDATRPRPNYEFLQISAAVRANVQDTMGLRFDTVRSPEIRWTKVQHEVDGKIVWRWFGEVIWPEGIRHGASKFSISSAGSDQCQACGHAIRDTGNWCSLVLDGPEGPASLWVGRDCARHLFGCKVSGEGTFPRWSTGATPVSGGA